MLGEYAIVALIPSFIIRTYTDIWWFSSWRTCAHAYNIILTVCRVCTFLHALAWSSSNALIHKPYTNLTLKPYTHRRGVSEDASNLQHVCTTSAGIGKHCRKFAPGVGSDCIDW